MYLLSPRILISSFGCNQDLFAHLQVSDFQDKQLLAFVFSQVLFVHFMLLLESQQLEKWQ